MNISASSDCRHCQGTGWIFVHQNGKETARPCNCQFHESEEQRRETANIPFHFRTTKFKNFTKPEKDVQKAIEKASRFAHDFPAVSTGLLFMGQAGVGKTKLLCSIANQLLEENNIPLYYIDWNDLSRQMRSGEDYSSRDFSSIGDLLEKLAQIPLLILDELGASRPSAWVEDNIYYLINHRYNREKITLFATNFFDQSLGGEETLEARIGLRIRSRIYEMTTLVEIKAPDYRRLTHF